MAQKKKEFYQIILSETPFYAEMGGQVGDTGYLEDTDGKRIKIIDTKRENNIGVHIATELPADPTGEFTAAIDRERRDNIAANHTATHLLHQALREVLGNHVEQKGSYVAPDVLRFDFSHFQKVTPEEIRKVEHIVNSRIRQAIPLNEHRDVPIADAKALGAMALFGEKYGDRVRVIRYGDSIELCGGTHVANTGNIGMVRIVSESSIAAGVRRIEAVSGAGVETMLDRMQDSVRDISAMFGNAADIKVAVAKAISENNDLRHKVEDFFNQRVTSLTKQILSEVKQINGINVAQMRGLAMPEVVKNVAFALRKSEVTPLIFVAATVFDKKPLLTVALTDDLVADGLNASKAVREAAKSIKGGGGGQPFFAQAGGKDADGLSKAFETLTQLLGIAD